MHRQVRYPHVRSCRPYCQHACVQVQIDTVDGDASACVVEHPSGEVRLSELAPLPVWMIAARTYAQVATCTVNDCADLAATVLPTLAILIGGMTSSARSFTTAPLVEDVHPRSRSARCSTHWSGCPPHPPPATAENRLPQPVSDRCAQGLSRRHVQIARGEQTAIGLDARSQQTRRGTGQAAGIDRVVSLRQDSASIADLARCTQSLVGTGIQAAAVDDVGGDRIQVDTGKHLPASIVQVADSQLRIAIERLDLPRVLSMRPPRSVSLRPPRNISVSIVSKPYWRSHEHSVSKQDGHGR